MKIKNELMDKFTIKTLFASAFLLISTSSFSATDGSQGATSSGTALITITKTATVMISGLSDFSFPASATSGDLSAVNKDICIYSSNGGAYTITATSDGSSGFKLHSTSTGDDINYTAKWNDVTGVTGSVAMTDATVLGSQTGASETSSNCGGAKNANLEITLDGTTFDAATASNDYTDTLTLLVAPL